MQFHVQVLQHRRSWGLRSMKADDMLQAESHLLELIRDYLHVSAAQSRCFYEVRTEGYSKLLFYGKAEGHWVKLKVELRQVL